MKGLEPFPNGDAVPREVKLAEGRFVKGSDAATLPEATPGASALRRFVLPG
jgi:hypothetical protein